MENEAVSKKNQFNQEEISHLAIDIGGTLIKMVYISNNSNSADDEGPLSIEAKKEFLSDNMNLHVLRGRLCFQKFETKKINDCIQFLSSKKLQDSVKGCSKSCDHDKTTITATGGGAFKFANLFREKLGITLDKADEMDCLVAGSNLLLKVVESEAFTYSEGRKEYLHIDQNDLYPYLLVNIGSGVSMLKVDGDGKFERVSGTSVGGGTFLGLGKLLTNCKSFDELLDLSHQGKNSAIDMLVGDIFGGIDYSKLGLTSSNIASSFGKAISDVRELEDYKPEDIACSLLRMISNNIGQIAYLNALRFGLKRIFFAGFFIRGHAYTMDNISLGVNFWSKGEAKAMFRLTKNIHKIFSIEKKMSSSVHVKEAIWITPSSQTPSPILPLSSLDSQLFLRFTIEYLLVYKPVPGLNKPGLVEQIKSALGQALVHYYPLAGRVRSRTDGSGLEVACGSQGALFIEAVVSDRTSSDEFDKAPRFGTQWRKFLSFHVADVLKGPPSVVVQLTWLSDDGATLCVGFNHCLIDGIGSGMFLNSFAELASRKCGLGGLKSMPVWDRHLMSPNRFIRTRTSLSSHPEFNRVSDLCGFSSRFVQEDLVPTQIIFSNRKLNELKKFATSTSWLTESSFTMFEVLSAHIWRSWAKALNLPSNQILKMLFSIDIRNRVKPNLPSNYYGNAFVLGCAQTSVRELIEKGLGYATELVKRAKERVDDEHVREVIESVSSSRVCPDSVGVLIVSQWSRLGLDRVDFGMGKPIHVAPVCTEKYCIFSPVPNQSDAVKVNVAVPASEVDQYLYLVRWPYTK